jgi:hypothetical protein
MVRLGREYRLLLDMSNSTYDFGPINTCSWQMENCDHLMIIWTYLRYKRTGDITEAEWPNSEQDVYRYIINGFKSYLKSNSLQEPPMTQAFWEWSVTELHSRILASAVYACPSELCKASGWEGSPDIAGVGVRFVQGFLNTE